MSYGNARVLHSVGREGGRPKRLPEGGVADSEYYSSSVSRWDWKRELKKELTEVENREGRVYPGSSQVHMEPGDRPLGGAEPKDIRTWSGGEATKGLNLDLVHSKVYR